jgi:hypothetical protein
MLLRDQALREGSASLFDPLSRQLFTLSLEGFTLSLEGFTLSLEGFTPSGAEGPLITAFLTAKLKFQKVD